MADTLTNGLRQLAKDVDKWATQMPKRLTKAAKEVGPLWVGAAQHRAPRDTDDLIRSITSEVIVNGNTIELHVGVPKSIYYATFVEFGTRWIAGGRVLALGPSPDVTDRRAVKSWPAKDIDSAGSPEQMPWLRPSFHAILPDALSTFVAAAGVDAP